MDGGRPTLARIDADALRANLAAIRERAPGREVIAVVKADAYGHGAPEVARILESAGVEQLAVLSVAEACALRDAGSERPILILAGVHDAEEAREAVARALVPVVHHEGGAALVARAAADAGCTGSVHVEVDTGMRRMGVAPGEAAALVARVAADPALALAGVFTHLARAEELDPAASLEQLALFSRLLATLRERGIDPGQVHAANSAGVLAWPAFADAAPATHAVRPGILLYGSNPAPHVDVAAEPVMTFATRVVHLRDVSPGDAVGYGALFRAPRRGRVATLAAGYADGVPRCAGEPGRPPAYVLVGNRRFPITGRVSMDYLTVFLDDEAADVALGDEAVLFGRSSGGATLRADELAAATGTIAYELFTRVGTRVPRQLVTAAGAR